uniref:Uncharacterized protein n=1 Tax=Anguilla anguilla TaxID=7936 RepID=A0A0E9RS44_ANGAN
MILLFTKNILQCMLSRQLGVSSSALPSVQLRRP